MFPSTDWNFACVLLKYVCDHNVVLKNSLDFFLIRNWDMECFIVGIMTWEVDGAEFCCIIAFLLMVFALYM